MANPAYIRRLRARRILLIAVVLLAGAAAGAFWKAREIERFYRVVTLFDENKIVENFRSMSRIFPHHVVRRAGPVFAFREEPRELPPTFEYEDETYHIDELLERTWTTGILVIKDDTILYEEYFFGNDQHTRNISWSVGKSFVSALIGIAIEEGHIPGVETSVSEIVPRLKGTGYEGVALKDVLQMSSGVRFNEDYADFFSDINRMGRVIALGNSINEFAASLEAEREPGTFNHYVSMDTQVLGMVLKTATGRTPSDYLEEKIWKRIGMQSDAHWLVDDLGMELVFGTLNVTVRDFARFGRLYANGGVYAGNQIVPAGYVRASVTPDAPHLQPGENPELSSNARGYGYQWWIPGAPRPPAGDFLALGVYGQYIYVNPERNVVIVKTSADPRWKVGLKTNVVLRAWFQHLAETL